MTILPLFKKVDDAGKHDTANRLKQRVKDIIHSARLSGIKTEIITNDLDVRLMQYETKHHAALHPRDLPDFSLDWAALKVILLPALPLS